MTHHLRSPRFGILLVLGAVTAGALLTPTAHAAVAQALSVLVTNTAANPVPVIARDPEAGHEPWHLFMKQDDEYVVPVGKRLVIEYATASFNCRDSISRTGPSAYSSQPPVKARGITGSGRV